MAAYLKPEFTALLDPGKHEFELSGVLELCVLAECFSLSITRREVLGKLLDVVRRLNSFKVTGELWIDGSFVTKKVDPEDVDILLRVSSDIYDSDDKARAVVDWASSAELLESHSCDAYRWIEYSSGHPLHAESEADRRYWERWFGYGRNGKPKGIVVVKLPATLP